jgi:hypothetical protein
MKSEPFLVAASATQEYGWVLLPNSIPRSSRGEVLRQLPSKVTPELALINLTFAGKTAFAAVRTERTVDRRGNAVRDESGRLLRHTFGSLFDRPIDARQAESEVGRITPQVKEALAAFLMAAPVELPPVRPPPEPHLPPPEPHLPPPEQPPRNRFGFSPWLAIGVGLAVLAGVVLWDLSPGQVTTLKALAADNQNLRALATETQKENQELDMRLLNEDETIRWLLRAPCRAQ